MRQQRADSTRVFYIALGVIAIIGIALVARTARHGARARQAIDVQATPAQAEGYLLGNPNAPVQIMEFADFECPACGQFATITEPDVRQRIVNTGLASYRFFDFPLSQHRNTMPASNAAACAADQGKFWQMHDKLFYGQPEWNGEATDDPMKVFSRYAKEIGLDVGTWTTCVEEQRHLPRILGNRAEGMRRKVQSTPTFVIGTKQIDGALSYDEIKAYVDSAAKQAASRPAAPAAGAGSTASSAAPAAAPADTGAAAKR
ncbi:MAG TPA: thioredoxin domain-containing protein [Gemmatimonadaceae bacterium]